MNRLYKTIALVALLILTGCSKLLELSNSSSEKEPDPIPVSMVHDGVYIEDLDSKTRSQFYIRKHSFSYYIRTYFHGVGISIKLLISSDAEFELDKWYDLPAAETETTWESFARIEYDKGYYTLDDQMAIAGRVRFTGFKQTGDLNYFGEGYCFVEGEFELSYPDPENPGETIEIEQGKFSVPKSRYWDARAMED